MSLDVLKAVRDFASAGVSAVENLFAKHQAAAPQAQAVVDAHASVSSEIASLGEQFKALVAQVEQAIAAVEAEVAVPIVDQIKALVAKL